MNDIYKIIKHGKEELRINNCGPDFEIPAEEWSIVKNVWTMLSDPEKRILWHLSKNMNETGDIVNLGHANGGSAHVMGLAMLRFKKKGTLRSVDLFKTRRGDKVSVCEEHLKKFKLHEKVQLYKGLTSTFGDVWLKEKLLADVIFIDAGHDYESVKHDWLKFSQLIIDENSTVAFHDCNQIHTDRVIQEYVDPRKWKQTYHVDRIKVFQRTRGSNSSDES